MNRRIAYALAIAPLILVSSLLVGVEEIHREHGEVAYDPFIKHAPSFTFVFENTAQCGECDLRPWSLMTEDARQRFAMFCSARFGLDDEHACYSMFEAKQPSASSPATSPTLVRAGHRQGPRR